MAKVKRQRYFFFKLLLAVGVLLGMLLLVQSAIGYRFVSQRLFYDELVRDSARHANDLLDMARDSRLTHPREFGPILEKLLRERPTEIAWLYLLNSRGEVVVKAGERPPTLPLLNNVRQLFRSHERPVTITETRAGKVLSTLRPLRYRWARQDRPPSAVPGAQGDRGGPIILDIGLYWNGVKPKFGGLQRAMIVQVSAAIALLAAMVFLGLRFRTYVQGKQLEQQLELARTVQQDLLPTGSPAAGNLDVSAVCDPAWQVGGDFYDIFQPVSSNRTALLLGDVSGKGLPAALLMSMLHGAIRSGLSMAENVDIEEATRRLNELICQGTAVERFVTMFWCLYDPSEGRLHYVNAGHLTPFLVSQKDGGEASLIRLDAGGPVLGVIPDAAYEQGTAPFRAGDLLVLYSDGVVEAANGAQEEFGEDRLVAILKQNTHRMAAEVRDETLRQVREFVGDEPPQDDLTLLVVRAGNPVVPSSDTAGEIFQTA